MNTTMTPMQRLRDANPVPSDALSGTAQDSLGQATLDKILAATPGPAAPTGPLAPGMARSAARPGTATAWLAWPQAQVPLADRRPGRRRGVGLRGGCGGGLQRHRRSPPVPGRGWSGRT